MTTAYLNALWLFGLIADVKSGLRPNFGLSNKFNILDFCLRPEFSATAHFGLITSQTELVSLQCSRREVCCYVHLIRLVSLQH